MKSLFTSILLTLSATTFAQIPSYVPSNGLVGWWPFNGNANDESGNGNNGTVLAGASLTSDRNGMPLNAYNIDGLTCMNKRGIEIPANINQASDFTISCWFKILNTTQGFQTIFCSNPHNTIAVGFNHPFGPNIMSSGVGDGSNWLYTGQSGNTFNCTSYTAWNHLVVVKNVQAFVYYLNGIVVRIQPYNTTFSNLNFTLDFGTINFSAWGCFETLNGSLDDIGIWNRALTACEIQQLYTSQIISATIDAGVDQTICIGELVTLQGSGGSSLTWNNGVVDGVSFEPTQTNSYVLSGSDSLGCIGIDTVLVSVLEATTSSQSQTAIDSYTWPVNGQTYTQSGVYVDTLVNAAGCDSIVTLNLELDFTGIESNTPTTFKLYPNPVKDELFIKGMQEAVLPFEVYSTDGKKVLSGTTSGAIDVNALKKGSYQLKIKEQAIPFVKQ